MKFACLSETICHYSPNPYEPPEVLCYYEEIEAENRNKAKWKFIQKCFQKTKFKDLPKISVKKIKPFLIIEEDPRTKRTATLLDDEMMPLCELKFQSEEQISKLMEILVKLDVPFSKESLMYFDTGELPDQSENQENIDAIHRLLDEHKIEKAPDDSASKLSIRVNQSLNLLTKERAKNEDLQATLSALRFQIDSLTQKVLDVSPQIIRLTNMEKLAATTAMRLEQENNELKNVIRKEISNLLDEEAENAKNNELLREENRSFVEVNQNLRRKLDHPRVAEVLEGEAKAHTRLAPSPASFDFFGNQGDQEDGG